MQNPASPQPSPLNASSGYYDFNDTQGHGSHTAGTVAAAGNNGVGVAGVAWVAQLVVCKFVWDDGYGYISDAMACLELCAGEGANIVTNSWGGVGYSGGLKV